MVWPSPERPQRAAKAGEPWVVTLRPIPHGVVIRVPQQEQRARPLSRQDRQVVSPSSRGVSPAADAPIAIPPASSTGLIESARTLAHEVGRAGDRPGMFPRRNTKDGAVPLEEKAVLPKLAAAMNKASAREERLQGGLVRITTGDGKVYCLRMPPDFAAGGPIVPLAVPTTCP